MVYGDVDSVYCSVVGGDDGVVVGGDDGVGGVVVGGNNGVGGVVVGGDDGVDVNVAGFDVGSVDGDDYGVDGGVVLYMMVLIIVWLVVTCGVHCYVG